MRELSIKTQSQTQFIDITPLVQTEVFSLGIKSGVCHVFIPHTTAAVTINENADPSVLKDIIGETNKLVPFEDGYLHLEGNSAAHIKASFYGMSETIFVRNASLALGTWQSIYFCEFDGPRNRKVWIKILSD
ncbi:secondary thiamine-phosphate synthase enzyme YjbQ [Chlamydiota bacterium]